MCIYVSVCFPVFFWLSVVHSASISLFQPSFSASLRSLMHDTRSVLQRTMWHTPLHKESEFVVKNSTGASDLTHSRDYYPGLQFPQRYCLKTFSSYFVIDWLVILLHIWEVPGSTIDREVRYLTSSKCWDHLLLRIFQIIILSHPPIWHNYKLSCCKNAVKNQWKNNKRVYYD